MTASTRFVCQTYKRKEKSKGKAKQADLVQASATECKTSAEAETRAHRMFESGTYAGVDAFSIDIDVELGDYSEPTFIARLGDVPPADV